MIEYSLILSTCPDQESATRLADELIDSNLAACVNILPGLLSIYKWKGKKESAQECLLLIKTTNDCYARLEQKIRDCHPYELPEIIAVPITAGSPAYLTWIANSVNKNSNNEGL